MSVNKGSALQKPRFSVAVTTPMYQQMIANTLSDPERVKRFVASITSAVAVNPVLQECEPHTILAAALLGESLNLSPSPQLGQFYLVPFEVKVKDSNGKATGEKVKHAQFILGYRGYLQLAIRSGQYKRINVMEIKEGELRSFDALNEEIDCVQIEDLAAREKAETIGYYAMYEYVNGFRKSLYWSKEKMIAHADKYSPAFSRGAYIKLQNNEIPEKDLWKFSSFWYKNFDMMAKKTMLRQLIGHWGVTSSELQYAETYDNRNVLLDNNGSFATTEGQPDYVSDLPAHVHEDDAAISEPPTEPPDEPEGAGAEQAEAVNLDDL